MSASGASAPGARGVSPRSASRRAASPPGADGSTAADPAATDLSADVAATVADAADVHEVGRVIDAWGVKGWVKVQPHADDPQALLQARRWLLQPPEGPLGGPAARKPLPAAIDISEVRRHGEFVVALPEGLADRGAAEALRGARVLVSRGAFPPPGRDEYYWVDLVGLEVVNRDGVVLGTVAGLLDNGAQAVLRVQAPAGDERMIPFVSAYVDDVDLAARRIRVDWGLDY